MLSEGSRAKESARERWSNAANVVAMPLKGILLFANYYSITSSNARSAPSSVLAPSSDALRYYPAQSVRILFGDLSTVGMWMNVDRSMLLVNLIYLARVAL